VRRRDELRELAIAVGAGFGGGDAIDESLPRVEMSESLQRDGFDTEKWWETYGSPN
jgi:hypothetical protein